VKGDGGGGGVEGLNGGDDGDEDTFFPFMGVMAAVAGGVVLEVVDDMDRRFLFSDSNAAIPAATKDEEDCNFLGGGVLPVVEAGGIAWSPVSMTSAGIGFLRYWNWKPTTVEKGERIDLEIDPNATNRSESLGNPNRCLPFSLDSISLPAS
jgi:hypothetical protein